MIDIEQIDGLLNAAGADAAGAVLQAFWSSTDDLVAMAASNLSVQDFDGLSSAAHAIKGAAANVGAKEISEAARDMETAARDRNAEDAAIALERVREAVEPAKGAFDAHIQQFREAS